MALEVVTKDTEFSSWDNDTIELDCSDLVNLMTGKELYFFDGEYGHTIKLDIIELTKIIDRVNEV